MPDLYDPYDQQVQEDPYPVYRRMRNEHPAYRNETRGFWALSRFEDIWTATHDPRRFSSASGIVIGQDMMAAAGDTMPMLIMMDPPRHDELRKVVSRAFTPRRMAAMEEDVRRITRELLSSFLERGEVEFVHEFAAPLPMIVIAEMLGVPLSDRHQFREWSDHLVKTNPDDPASMERTFAAAIGLNSYFEPMLEARRADPQDDLMSALLAAESDGQKLSQQELIGFCFLLLVAGNETTTNLISNAAAVLHDRPDLRRNLTEDLSLLPAAVEEFLRLESPVQGLARTLTEDVEMHGELMREGDKVLLLFGSANRDEREFDNPDEFVLDRSLDRGLAFGHGIHYCLGAALARLECRVAFEELLPLVAGYVIGDGAQRLLSGPIRGFDQLPVTFQAASDPVNVASATRND
jgi:hypothetical protein